LLDDGDPVRRKPQGIWVQVHSKFAPTLHGIDELTVPAPEIQNGGMAWNPPPKK
jgi:hypothetical protein